MKEEQTKGQLNKWIRYLLFSMVIVIISRLFFLVFYHIFLGIESGLPDIWGNLWDNEWYKSIIIDGYDLFPTKHPKGDAANWAFFPLDSFVIRCVWKIFPVTLNSAAFLTNTLFLILSITIAIAYIMETRANREIAAGFAIMSAFGPYTLFFSSFYTESLYIFLTFCAYYCLKKHKYIAMGLAGALLSATRNTGVLFVFVILLVSIREMWEGNLKKFVVDILSNGKLVLGTSLVPLGLFSYMAYLGGLMGDPLAFVHIQRAWHEKHINPVQLFMEYVSDEYWGARYLALFLIFTILLIARAIYKKRLDEMIIPIFIILMVITYKLISIPRYMISTGMFVLAMLDLIHSFKYRWLTWICYFLLMLLSLRMMVDWTLVAWYLQ